MAESIIMGKSILVGTRPSKLALKQVEEIKKRVPEYDLQTVKIQTLGDKDKHTPLGQRENSDFFTREIECALLKGSIDIAVHSAKDLEEESPEQLRVIAMTKSISIYDCLISRGNRTLEKLRKGAVIGTSSNQRKTAVKSFREDLIVKDIRGNVDDRIAQLDNGMFDAIIVAHAALIRLGLEHRIAQIIPISIVKPHISQGRLAIQARRERKDMNAVFGRLHES